MKRIIFKIQSISDIITNSSSELFTIQTHKTIDEFTKTWTNLLEMLEYDISDETLFGEIKQYESNEIIIEFPYMCNLDSDAEDVLKAVFGKRNVDTRGW